MAQDPEKSPDEGQVSEIGRMDPAEADTPISDSQGVYGNPSDERVEHENEDDAATFGPADG